MTTPYIHCSISSQSDKNILIMEIFFSMDTNEDYLVWSNGIKIQKDLVEKANQNGKYTKKNSNHYEKSISKRKM